MFPFILFPLIAGVIAIVGYRYLAKRQPEYPNGRVIATFTLLGGGLGGLLVTFLIYLTVVINSPSPLIDDSLPQRFLRAYCWVAAWGAFLLHCVAYCWQKNSLFAHGKVV